MLYFGIENILSLQNIDSFGKKNEFCANIYILFYNVPISSVYEGNVFSSSNNELEIYLKF